MKCKVLQTSRELQIYARERKERDSTHTIFRWPCGQRNRLKHTHAKTRTSLNAYEKNERQQWHCWCILIGARARNRASVICIYGTNHCENGMCMRIQAARTKKLHVSHSFEERARACERERISPQWRVLSGNGKSKCLATTRGKSGTHTQMMPAMDYVLLRLNVDQVVGRCWQVEKNEAKIKLVLR